MKFINNVKHTVFFDLEFKAVESACIRRRGCLSFFDPKALLVAMINVAYEISNFNPKNEENSK